MLKVTDLAFKTCCLLTSNPCFLTQSCDVLVCNFQKVSNIRVFWYWRYRQMTRWWNHIVNFHSLSAKWNALFLTTFIHTQDVHCNNKVNSNVLYIISLSPQLPINYHCTVSSNPISKYGNAIMSQLQWLLEEQHIKLGNHSSSRSTQPGHPSVGRHE